ncbi:calcineurin catalytic subunit A [Pichia kluyveri]|uniref:Serine/threonine-protein phosphatase n=1 Tax=Pichia kluyveri TaxID=36015 RepID=A0AAV5R213_PICKL|nr:calcineurin catalytic subunit A [Pichia kluyveri]
MAEPSAKEKLTAHENTIKIENALRKMNQSGMHAKRDPTIYIDDNGKEFSTIDRIVTTVDAPTSIIPEDSVLFANKGGLPDYKFLREHFKREGKLKESQVLKIIKMATKIFENEPNMLHIPSPVTICGDIHGQLYDLCKLFEICGDPDKTSFLFLGDYVDRGSYSLEVLILLYCMKVNHPKTFTMLRGNHESKQMTQHFTFKGECLIKYSIEVYHQSLKSFCALPICAIMNKQFFCVHGGISKDIKYLSEINDINRFQVDFPSHGPYCDLVWSDPSDTFDDEIYGSTKVKKFKENYERGCSYMYSYNAVCQFLERNNLLCVIRAHQAQDKGYRMYKNTTQQKFPAVITLFSAPNYCGTYGNKAAVLKYDVTTMNIRQFSSQPEPYHLPNFMNVFNWSAPFVAERVVEILFSVLNVCTDEELDNDTPLSKELTKSLMKIQNEQTNKKNAVEKKEIEIEKIEVVENKENGIETDKDKMEEDKPIDEEEQKTLDQMALRNKILAIGRLSRMLQMLRQESAKVEQLRAYSGGLTLPKGVLLDGNDELDKQLSHFERVRRADMTNEGLPPTVEEKDKEDHARYKKLWARVSKGL